MENATDEIIKRLEYDWPLWEIWVVRRVVADPVWCARRTDIHRRVLNAGSSDALADYFEEASTQ